MTEQGAEKGQASKTRMTVVGEPPHRVEHPCDHGHRWAWAQLVSGGVRQVCRVCGRERR